MVVNATLLNILEYQSEELQGQHIESILPIASRVFYQTHLFPLLKMRGKADEIFLSLQTKSRNEVPVLTNAIRWKRKGQIFNNWVFMPMHRRSEYEDQIVRLKKAAEEAQKALESKQTELFKVDPIVKTQKRPGVRCKIPSG